MKECTSCSYIRSNMHLKSLILLSALFTLAYAQDEEPPPELPTSPKDILKGAFKKGHSVLVVILFQCNQTVTFPFRKS